MAEMDRDHVLARLKPLLREALGVSEATIEAGDIGLLGENSGIDSVGVLRLVMAVEKGFGIVIADSDITPDNLRTLSGLIALISRKLQGSHER